MTLWGTPIHPALVHLPIGLFVGAWVLDLAGRIFKKGSLSTAAVAVFALAAVCVLPAAVTGLLEQNRLHLNHPLVNSHRNFGLALWAVSWIFLGLMARLPHDPSKLRLVFGLACWVCAGLAVYAGYLGGEMVYGYGIGTSK